MYVFCDIHFVCLNNKKVKILQSLIILKNAVLNVLKNPHLLNDSYFLKQSIPIPDLDFYLPPSGVAEAKVVRRTAPIGFTTSPASARVISAGPRLTKGKCWRKGRKRKTKGCYKRQSLLLDHKNSFATLFEHLQKDGWMMVITDGSRRIL